MVSGTMTMTPGAAGSLARTTGDPHRPMVPSASASSESDRTISRPASDVRSTGVRSQRSGVVTVRSSRVAASPSGVCASTRKVAGAASIVPIDRSSHPSSGGVSVKRIDSGALLTIDS